ncbi:MAG: cobalt-precorrin-5B (C(1))-methyltransferase CbiD [Lachnospiraceae bacterium]
MDHFIYKDQKKMRLGYTTGTCATAATKAAAQMLLGGKRIEQVELLTPKGIPLQLKVEQIVIEENRVSCAIRKDAGDDYDVTNGMYVIACVEKIGQGYEIEGGEGVGRVTKPGLDQSVGNCAINTVPRQMMAQVMMEAADAYGYEGGLRTIISVPEGAEIAKKTLNQKLGIEGGISILGTSGIVEPMSETALIDTIRTELSMYCAQGQRDIIITPGNYGESFLTDQLGLDLSHTVKCSNFIGETIDMAYEFQLSSLLLIGHLGKLVKLGSGIMNTHSKYADGRMETLSSCVLLAGGTGELARRILDCNTTDEAVEVLWMAAFLPPVMEQLMKKIDSALKQRAFEGLRIEAVVFSNRFGVLGKTKGADQLMMLHRE